MSKFELVKKIMFMVLKKIYRSRKRRPSSGNESDRSSYGNSWAPENGMKIGFHHNCFKDEHVGCVAECTAAMVLMSLSNSPHSPHYSLQHHSSAHCQFSSNNRKLPFILTCKN